MRNYFRAGIPDRENGSLSYSQDVLIKYKREFTPIEISRELSVTNKTVINRLSVLAKNGFVVPNLVKERIRSYELSEFAKNCEKEIVGELTE